MNYSYDGVEAREIIQNYKTSNNKIIITFLDGTNYEIPLTEENEINLLNQMLEQAEERSQKLSIYDLKKERTRTFNFIMTYLGITVLSISNASTTDSKDIRCLTSIVGGITALNVILDMVKYKFKNDKIKFKDKYNNYSLLSYNEVLNSYKLIDKMKRKIKKYDLTPLEQIIFLYDKVRKKPYKAYDKDQSTSRDINEVLNNDYVVCEGYANVISAVCNALNINCEKILWKPFEGNIGHASNLVYINDDYYNVHQFFEIDAVVATKKNEKDYDYINNYKLFLLPLKYAVGIKEKYNNLTIGYKLGVEQLNDRYNTADRFKAIAAPDILTMNSIQLYLKGMMELANKIGNKELIQKCRKIESEFKNDSIDFEKVQKIHEEYQKLFIKKIKKDVMIEALYKVKRIEYLIDPNEYKLDIDSFKKMIDCNFPKSQEEKLLEVIFDDINGYFDNVKYLKTIDGNNLDEKVEKDIKRIEFLNILKRELKSRKGKVNVKK